MMNHGKPHYFYKSVLFFDFLKCRPYLDDTQNLPDYYSYNSENCLVKLWTDARILKLILLKNLYPAFCPTIYSGTILRIMPLLALASKDTLNFQAG